MRQRLIFLSTLSLRRATSSMPAVRSQFKHFYPRSPCGERLGQCLAHCITNSISIHALLAESDVFLLRKITITVDISIHALLAESDFKASHLLGVPKCISIHALLAESDRPVSRLRKLFLQNFYPRSPCGERLSLHVSQIDA